MAKKTVKKRAITKKKPIPSGRNAGGKFTKGNQAGKVSKSPAAKRKETLAQAFKAAITVKDVKAIAKEMLKLAKKGNVKAAQLVLDRCCGKVTDHIEHTLDKETATLLGLIDGSSKGKLPTPDEADALG
jgi:hypothetical protein